jgi:DNA-binding NarL/FixJ family response regulator
MSDPNKSSGDAQDETASILRIVLVEDHAILRDGLRSLLNMEVDFEVVGEADSCEAGMEVIRSASPDIVITDIGLPGRSGLTLIPEIKQHDGAMKVLVLTAHCTDEYVRVALDSGADGYVLKDASREELVTGIRSVAAGERYLSTLVMSRVVSGFLDKDAARQPSEGRITPRETEVMILIASAKSTKEIARILDLSVKTVEKHRSNLMRKLGLSSSAAVTLYAVRNNYLSVDGVVPEGPER